MPITEVKLCECGCGKPAPVATKTQTKDGHTKGEPVRFIQGHGGRYGGRSRGLFKSNRERWLVSTRDGLHIPWSRIVYSHYFLKGEDVLENRIIHHKDGRQDNDSPDNLEMMCPKEHIRIHLLSQNYMAKKIILKKGAEIHAFPSALQASKWLGMNKYAVGQAKYRKRKIRGWDILKAKAVMPLNLPWPEILAGGSNVPG